MENESAQYFSGWTKTESGWAFRTFPGFTTHQKQENYEAEGEWAALSAAESDSLVRRFRTCFSLVQDPLTRWLLLGFYHAAFLYSLLNEMGYPIPHSLYLYTHDSAIEDFFLRLFSWYGDPPLSLDDNPTHFRQGVLDRNDQPLLIRDCRRTAHAAENTRYLEETMAGRRVHRPREKDFYPLRSLPIIISDTPSVLSCNPDTLVLELGAEEFNCKASIAWLNVIEDTKEYLLVFAHYVTGEISRLEEDLKKGMLQARTCDCELSLEAQKTMGALLGTNLFVERFWNSHHMPKGAKFDVAELAGLGALMEELSYKNCGSDLAKQFLLLTAAMIQDGRLTVRPTDRAPTGDESKDCVFFDDRSVYFPTRPFRDICRQLGRSSPATAHALLEAGVCIGKPASGTTMMTRVTICNVYGQRRKITAYRVDRSFLESDGEPLLMGGKEWSDDEN